MFGRKTHRPEGVPAAEAGSQAPSSLLATCPCCGDVVVDVTEAKVVRGEGEAGQGWYSFRCPRCRGTVDVPAPQHLVTVLICLGARELALDVHDLSALLAG